jgi:C-terminal peptidase prc
MWIQDGYVDPDHGGLDWEAVREEYTEKVANAASDEEFYALMEEMVNLLDDKYSSFLSPDAVALEEALYEGLTVPGGIGAYLSEVDGALVLIQVFPDAPAFEAGLRPGEHIVAVDGVPWEQFSGVQEAIRAIVGEVGTEVDLTVRSVDGEERQVPVTRAVIDLEEAQVRGTVVDGTNVGLLTLNGFDSPQVPGRVRETLTELMSGTGLEGLIVDVRANPGGDVELALDTLALFVDGGPIGSQAGNTETVDLVIPAGETLPEVEGLPMVVLVGPHTRGAGEYFAAGLQLHGGASLVGEPSAGDTAYGSWYDLSDGSTLWLAERVYQLPDGTLVEGRGVQPDRVVAGDWALYRTEDDPQIQAAMDLLASE